MSRNQHHMPSRQVVSAFTKEAERFEMSCQFGLATLSSEVRGGFGAGGQDPTVNIAID